MGLMQVIYLKSGSDDDVGVMHSAEWRKCFPLKVFPQTLRAVKGIFAVFVASGSWRSWFHSRPEMSPSGFYAAGYSTEDCAPGLSWRPNSLHQWNLLHKHWVSLANKNTQNRGWGLRWNHKCACWSMTSREMIKNKTPKMKVVSTRMQPWVGNLFLRRTSFYCKVPSSQLCSQP